MAAVGCHPQPGRAEGLIPFQLKSRWQTLGVTGVPVASEGHRANEVLLFSLPICFETLSVNYHISKYASLIQFLPFSQSCVDDTFDSML